VYLSAVGSRLTLADVLALRYFLRDRRASYIDVERPLLWRLSSKRRLFAATTSLSSGENDSRVTASVGARLDDNIARKLLCDVEAATGLA
jgi:hypothetical protein